MRRFQRSAWELPVLKRLFPTIARLTADWPPVKWAMAPLVVAIIIMMLAGLIRAVDPAIAHLFE